jgi:NADPH2:quinone reductase
MVCERLEGPRALVLRDFERAALQPGQVRVGVAAAGLNFPDLLMTRGQYQLKPPLPFIPGMEVAGRILELGPGVADWQPGEAVIALPRPGGFATEVVVPADRLFRAPAPFTMAEAACFLLATHTARHALLDRGRLTAGERVLVLGAGGGVGLAAVEVAALCGAEVIAAASSPAKLEAARARGARHLVDYARDDLRGAVKALAPGGVDIVFDPVGGDLFEASCRLMAWAGRLLVIGFASGRIGTVPANMPLIKGYSVVGVRAGEFGRRDPAGYARSVAEVLSWAGQGRLRPHICARFALAEAGAALEELEQRRALGRVALVV